MLEAASPAGKTENQQHLELIRGACFTTESLVDSLEEIEMLLRDVADQRYAERHAEKLREQAYETAWSLSDVLGKIRDEVDTIYWQALELGEEEGPREPES